MASLSSLNPQQRLAVETIRGPVLILAGAGTGKTRVITHRISHMIRRGVSPENILAVTFTNKAAREMQERVRKLIPKPKGRASGEKEKRPTICTFHSLCVRVLRRHIDRLGYKKNFVIYSASEQLGAIKKILSQISAKGQTTDPAAILALLSRYRNGGSQASAFEDDNLRGMAEHIRSRYESALQACNAVDFDDLILLALRLFHEHEEVLEACRNQYQYVMVDEYQDTNSKQFDLVHALTREHRNFCVVGDDDQSIYGWRGAEIANLLELENHFPEVKTIKLEQNYRSTNTILEAANAVILNNVRRKPKRLWSGNGSGSLIRLACHADDEVEARTVVEEIEFQRKTRRVGWSEQAILFRTNQQSRPLETALRKAGVRYHLIGGQSFFDRREIKDFLAFMNVLVNPDDDINLLRIANVPARGLSDNTMQKILAASHDRHCSVCAAMSHTDVLEQISPAARRGVRRLMDLLEPSRAALESEVPISLKAWADDFLKRVDYFEELRRIEKDSEVAESRIRNVTDMAAALDERGGAKPPMKQLQSFLDEISLDADRFGEEDKPRDAVTLITMHSCKGLEFPHVYIVGLEEGLLPHSRSKQEGTLDEERRLFYVGITRAMKTLTLSHCEARRKYGQLMPGHPSRFLAELPETLVEDMNELAKKPVAVEAGESLFSAIKADLD